MAFPAALPLAPTKRKYAANASSGRGHGHGQTPLPKKQRVLCDTTPQIIPATALSSSSTSTSASGRPQQTPIPMLTPTLPPHVSLTLQPHQDLLARLRGTGFEIKTMSVLSSTSIRAHVHKALAHLGRFSPWDRAVLPGVVLLHARADAANKLITIAALVRERIGEAEQKWFQYNVLNEIGLLPLGVDGGGAGPGRDPDDGDDDDDYDQVSVIEETTLPSTYDKDDAMQQDDGGSLGGGRRTGRQGGRRDRGGQGSGGSGHHAGRTLMPSVHEQAVRPIRSVRQAVMSVFLSRVPVDELRKLDNMGQQTNEAHIDQLRRKKMGLAA